MRRNRAKTRKNNNGKVLTFIGAVVLLCVLSVSIGYFGTKYFLIPKYITKQNSSTNEKTAKKNTDEKPQGKANDETTPVSKESKETTNTSEKQSAEKKLYTFEIPPLSIFNVQVGSFDDMSHAQKQVDSLKDKGLAGYIVESDRYRVMVMSFVERESAEKYKNSIKSDYSDAFISPKQLAARELNYGDQGKAYSETASKEIKELKKYYENYSSFLTNNDISSVESKVIIQFVDDEINRLSGIIESISAVTPSDDFADFNSEFLSIAKTSKTKLMELKESNLADRTKLSEVFMESLNSYEGII